MTLVYEIIEESQKLSASNVSLSICNNLRILTLCHYDTEFSASFDDLRGITTLPALEEVRGFAVSITGEDFQNHNQYHDSHYTFLKVDRSLIDAAGLGALLSTSKQLETLIVEVGDSTVGDCEIDYRAMGHALRRHARKMRVLRLDFDEAFFWDDEDESERPSLGSLRELESLVDLDLSWPALFEADTGISSSESSPTATPTLSQSPNLTDILPPSIEDLTIRSRDEDAEMAIAEQIMLLIQSNMSGLKRVTINTITPLDLDLTDTGWRSHYSHGRCRVQLKRRNVLKGE